MLRLLRDDIYARVSCREERELIAAAQAADLGSRNALITSHIPFIITAVEHLLGPQHPLFEDMINEGVLGDVIGIERFDLGREGVRYHAYGYWWIRDAIASALRTEDNSIMGSAVNLENHGDALDWSAFNAFKRDPHKIPSVIVNQRDLFEAYQEGGMLQGIDLLDEMLKLTNGELDQRQRGILIRYYRDGWTIRQIAEVLGFSNRWVSVLKNRAMDEIRDRVDFVMDRDGVLK